MKANIEIKSGLERKLDVQIPTETVNDFFKKATLQVQKKSNIKGFRAGKAPLETVKKVYSDSILKTVADDLINKHFAKGLVEHQIQMAGEPEFEFGWPIEGKEFQFSAYFEVYPEVTVDKYEGLEAEELSSEVSENEVMQTIERLQNNWAAWEQADHAVKAQDQVTINFSGKLEGVADPRLSGQNLSIVIGAKQMIEGFEDGLLGLSVGDKKTLKLKFPEGYHSADLSNKDVEFDVEIVKNEKKVLPALDAEFAKRFGKESMEELKTLISEDMKLDIAKKSKNHLEETLVRSLVAANPTDVPKYYVGRQKTHLEENFKKDWQEKGYPEQDIQEYIAKWSDDFDKLAKEMIQAEFLVMELAKAKQLEATEEDFANRLEEYAKQTGIELARMKEHYMGDRAQNLMQTITREKVMKMLLAGAKLKSISKLPESLHRSF